MWFYVVLFFSGTNEATITEVLAHRTIAQRQRIKEAYKQALGKVRALPELCSQAANRVNENVFFIINPQTWSRQSEGTSTRRICKAALMETVASSSGCSVPLPLSTVYFFITFSLRVGFCCANIVLIVCKLTINFEAETNTTSKQTPGQRGLVVCYKGERPFP